MSYVVFLVGLVLVIPFSGWIKQSEKNRVILWFGFGIALFLYSMIPQFGISIVEDRLWPGYAKGAEITVIDLAALAYVLASRGDKAIEKKLPFRTWMKLYFAAVCAAVIISGQTRIGMYYVLQVCRVYLTFTAVSYAMQDRKLQKGLLDGISISLFGELLLVIYQKIIVGVAQPSGTFGHQNQLGMTSNMMLIVITTPFFALATGKLRYMAIGSGFAIPALIASRACAVLGLAGLATSYLMSLVRGSSPRKVKLGVLGAVAIALLVPIALASFQGRFKSDNWNTFEDEDYDERAAYKRAAWAIIGDHPLGVGPNNFVVTANASGYYASAGVSPNMNSLAGHVHNIYLLTTAEVGYPGLITLLPLFFVPAWTAWRWSLKLKGTDDGEMLGGCAIALLFAYLHSFYEWMFIGADPQYVLVTVYGIIAGITLRVSKSALSSGRVAGSGVKPMQKVIGY